MEESCTWSTLHWDDAIAAADTSAQTRDKKRTRNIAAPELECSEGKRWRETTEGAGIEWTRASRTGLHRELRVVCRVDRCWHHFCWYSSRLRLSMCVASKCHPSSSHVKKSPIPLDLANVVRFVDNQGLRQVPTVPFEATYTKVHQWHSLSKH